jgi:RsiW-degrading membrane proteinase PrsW (M82 family)
MNLLLLALAPGIVITMYVYLRDKYEREPLKLVSWTFALGALAGVGAGIAEAFFPYNDHTATLAATAANATLVVAPIEEVAKFLVVWLIAYRSPAFNEPFDGVVYCVMASMGFATLENILYVTGYGAGVGLERAFFSVPGHAAYGIVMGYYMGRAKFDTTGKRGVLLLTGLVFAIVLHGLFDFGLMSHSGAGLLLTLFTFGFAVRYAFKAMRESSRLSGEYWASEKQA